MSMLTRPQAGGCLTLSRLLGLHAGLCLAQCITVVCRFSLGGVNPVLGLLVLGVINLLRGVDGGVKVLQDAPRLLCLAINQQVVAARRKTCFYASLWQTHGHDKLQVEHFLACACHCPCSALLAAVQHAAASGILICEGYQVCKSKSSSGPCLMIQDSATGVLLSQP